jgi:hypothetical protein
MIEKEDKTELFEWLTETRDSGRINMMFAPSEMEWRFNMTKSEARQTFNEWSKWLEDKGTK